MSPQSYFIDVAQYSLTQDTIADFTIPAKKVNIHIQDSVNNAISNVAIKTQPADTNVNNNLSIGAGITNASGQSSYGSNGIMPTTDSSGNTTIWLFPNDPNIRTYSIVATPPNGSSFGSATISNVTVTDTTYETFTLPQSITLSGHVYDSSGNPLSNQVVDLFDANGTQHRATTDTTGVYSLQVTSGTFENLEIFPNSENTLLSNVPEHYFLNVNSYSLTQNTVLDFTLPAKKVTVHVQDALGNTIPNAQIKTLPSDNFVNNNLTISSNISNAQGVSSNGYNNEPAPTTDASGNAVMWLFPNDPNIQKYSIIATPPTGSVYGSATISNLTITTDTTETIILPQSITLSGHVYDYLGNSISNQIVDLFDSNGIQHRTTTDSSGLYSLSILSGNYELEIFPNNPNIMINNVPESYFLHVGQYSLTQNTIEDFTIPVKKVSVHIQDTFGVGIGNIQIKTLPADTNMNNVLSIGTGISNASGQSSYGGSYPSPITDASGNAVLWLIPNDPSVKTYSIVATPSSGSIYSQFTINNITVSDNQTELISLQYSHNPPVTTANLITQHSDGTYSDPTTVTLSATAVSGYTIANTYYTVDGGVQQTYTAPFTVSGTGNHTLTYWSVDNSGVQETHNTKTFTIHTNQPPYVNSLNGAAINAGATYTENGSFTDADSTSWTATVDYGEGAGPIFLSLNSDKTFSLSHQYNTAGTYTVTIVVTDNQGATGTTMTSVTVNAQPQITGLTNTSINYQDDFMENGTFTDTDSTSWTGTVDYGAGAGQQTLSLSSNHNFTLAYLYPAAGVYIVTVKITDNQGAVGTASVTVAVNAPPHINQLTSATISEGQTYITTGSFADTDSTSWTATVNYGDGTGSQGLNLNADRTFSLSHLYQEEGTYTVTVSITDNQGAIGTGNATVTVNNAPFTVGTISASINPVQVNTPTSASASFTDPGVLDTHTASWNWGDGTTTTGTVTENNGSGSVSNSHTYTTAGVYPITLTVTDDDGVSQTSVFQYLSVYNPTAQGLFSAGQHFTSPAGAYLQNPSLTGTVRFGLSYKYQGTMPVGTRQFSMDFTQANLQFNATTVNSLVIANGTGTLTGTGTINGAGTYNFLVTGNEQNTTIRIQITDASGNVIYDTQPGTAGNATPTTSVTGNVLAH